MKDVKNVNIAAFRIIFVNLFIGLYVTYALPLLSSNPPVLTASISQNLIIGSFNIQSLGPTKMSRPEFVDVASRILIKYDIVLVQEIKDSSVTMNVINSLVRYINEHVETQGISYTYAISPRLGQTSYKEQLAFIYRSSDENVNRKIKIISQYVYEDVNNVYDRPPFVSNFNISFANDSIFTVNQFSLMNVHLRPTNVFNESMELRRVVDEHRRSHDPKSNFHNNIAIIGDYNIDCSYLSKTNRQLVRSKLYDFQWFIRDGIATTVGINSCAYDRILISGFEKSVVENSNMTYYYQNDFELTIEEVRKISDHYPIQFQLK